MSYFLSFSDEELLLMELVKIDEMSLLHESKQNKKQVTLTERYLSYLCEQPITKYVLLTGADKVHQRVLKNCSSRCSTVSRILNTKCQMKCKESAAEAAIDYLNSRAKACEALNDPESCKEYVDRLISRYEENANKLRAKISYLET
mgnify:CR=1 FL=1